MSPVFSIIMTSFNYAPYIGAAIESVLTQSFLDWELIIIDDCSTDSSWEIIQNFEDGRIKAFRQSTNSGACAAYNRGLRTAKGQYIASLDSDDIFLPNKLERQFQFLLNHPEVDVCGSYVAEINKDGKLNTSNEGYSSWFNIQKELNNPENWLWENHLCHSSVVIRSEAHKRIGEFQIDLKFTPDWQFWIRALINNCCFSVIDEPLVKYRNHDNNITHQSPADVVWEHAETSVTYLLPWLNNLGRKDLIEKLIYGFIYNPAFMDSQSIQFDLLKHKSSNSSRLEVSITALQILISQIEKLKLGNEWLASQSAAWEKAASQRDNSIANLEADLSASKAALQRIRGHAGVRFINFFTQKKLF